MINRAALILKYKAPAIKWVNDADPYNDDPRITEENIKDDQTVYLISEGDAESYNSNIRCDTKSACKARCYLLL